ncbi:MAG: GWxTD domain-containing protein [Candidatus Kapaibacterium sp.]
MKSFFRLVFISSIFVFLTGSLLRAQFAGQIQDETAFYLDAIAFKAAGDDQNRLDVYVVVPFSTLRFEKAGEKYAARYQAVIKVFDSTGAKTTDSQVSRRLSADTYFQAQGGAGDFDRIQRSFYLPKGKYRVEIVVIDDFDKKEYVRSRNLTIIDFDEYDFALSGIMLVSDIEERDGKYIITPYISDNIGQLDDAFFAFFESYNKRGIDSADFIYEIYESEDEALDRGKPKTFALGGKRGQHYLRIEKPDNISAGKYILQIIALRPGAGESPTNKDVLAMARRSIEIKYSISGQVMSDLDEAIRQMRYVATGNEIDHIENAETRREKEKRFLQFWRKMDPTPNTDRNEAFQQYYARIQYANKNFKSYAEGWRTDMGKVYVIFGPPFQVENFRGYDGKIYQRWIYRSNREFLFVDNTGFGDYRLVQPYAITELYEFEN